MADVRISQLSLYGGPARATDRGPFARGSAPVSLSVDDIAQYVFRLLPYTSRMNALFGSSLIGYWPLNEPSGTPVLDASGNARNLAYVGTPVYGVAGIGDGLTSVNFNAAAEIDAYTASLAAAINFDAVSFGWWAVANDPATYTDATVRVMMYFGASATMYCTARANGDNTISFLTRRGATVKAVAVNGPTTNRLVHFGFTVDTANDTIKGFINGTQSRPATAIGTWSGSLISSYGRWADTSPAIANNNWAGRMAHAFVANGIATKAQMGLAAMSIKQLVCVGDSRSNLRQWPQTAMETAFPTGSVAYGGRGLASWALSGYTLELIASEAALYDALIRPEAQNTLSFWAGLNNYTDTAQQMYDKIKAFCVARRAAGWNKIIVCTEIDAQGAVPLESWHNSKYTDLNTLLRNDHSFADALIDLGADARLQDATNETYFLPDHIHENPTGAAVIASIAAPVYAAIA